MIRRLRRNAMAGCSDAGFYCVWTADFCSRDGLKAVTSDSVMGCTADFRGGDSRNAVMPECILGHTTAFQKRSERITTGIDRAAGAGKDENRISQGKRRIRSRDFTSGSSLQRRASGQGKVCPDFRCVPGNSTACGQAGRAAFCRGGSVPREENRRNQGI